MVKSLFILIYHSFSYTLENLSPTGTPPPPLINPTSAYHPASQTVYIYGGETQNSFLYSSSLYAFSLQDLKYYKVQPKSNLRPPPLSCPNSFFQSSKKFIVFNGKTEEEISPGIYSFDLSTETWEITYFIGDYFEAVIGAALTTFEYESINYTALFGGVGRSGISEKLYLINQLTLEVQLMPNNGTRPGKQVFGSLSYFNQSLYYFGQNSSDGGSLFFKYNIKSQTWENTGNELVLPAGRQGHSSFVFKTSLYLFFGYNSTYAFSSYQIFSLDSLTWSAEFYTENMQGFSPVQLSNLFLFICGKTQSGYQNSIVSFNPSTLKQDLLVPNNLVPQARKDHTSFVYNNEVYLYAGSQRLRYFNDMWKFSIQKKIWEEVKLTGFSPEGRDKMNACAVPSKVFIVIGGKSNDKIHLDNQVYFFDSNIWGGLEINNQFFSAKFGGCLVTYLTLYAVLIGGQDFNRAYSEIWYYSYPENSYTQLTSPANKLPFELINFKCIYTTGTASIVVYIIGGTTFEKIPNKKIYSLSFNMTEIPTFSIKSSDLYLDLSDHSVVFDQDRLFILGGRDTHQKVNKNLIIYDIKNKLVKYIPLQRELWLYSHSAVQAGNSIYIFGGVQSIEGYDTSSIPNNNFYKLTFDSSDSFQLSCYGGEDPDCGICKPGYYLNDFKCTPCPAGTYSKTFGAVDDYECKPCTYGTFNNKTGSTYCKDCPSNTYCPMRSSHYLYPEKQLSEYSKNPEKFETNTEYINYIMSVFIYAYLVFAFVIVIVWASSTFIKKLFKNFDIFINLHEQDLNVPVVYKKTSVGGLFSIAFLVFSFMTITFALYSYVTDNVYESKYLTPLAMIDEEITAESLNLTVELHNFPPSCIYNSNCSTGFQFITSGFTSNKSRFVCSYSSNTCFISMSFYQIKLVLDPTVTVKIIKKYSLSSSIAVSLIVSSSIPSQYSQVFIPIYPDSIFELFEGLSPSVFQISLIPSVLNKQVFYSDVSRWPSVSTGYHAIDLKNHVKGSTVNDYQVNQNIGLVVTVSLAISTSALITERKLNIGVVFFLGTLLGSVFGLMGMAGSLMGGFESGFKTIKKRLKKRREIKKYIQTRRSAKVANTTIDETISNN